MCSLSISHSVQVTRIQFNLSKDMYVECISLGPTHGQVWAKLGHVVPTSLPCVAGAMRFPRLIHPDLLDPSIEYPFL